MMTGVARAADTTCPAKAFYVEGVEVSAEAATSEEARQTATDTGLGEAWAILKARLLLPEQDDASLADVSGADIPGADIPGADIPGLDIPGLRDLLDYTRIDQETVLPGRYLGQLDYCFDRVKTREFFTANALKHAELPSGPMLVLPVLNANNTPQLWRRPNFWAEAWEAALDGRDGLVDLRLAASLSVERAVDVAPVMKGDRATIAKAAKLEQTERVIIAILTPTISGDNATLTVAANLYDRNGQFESTVYGLDDLVVPIDQVVPTLDWLVGDMVGGIETVWRTANEVNIRDSGILTLNVPAVSIEDWSRQITILKGLAPVESLSVVQLSATGGIVRLDMAGSLTSLNYALEPHLLTLEENRNNGAVPLTLVP
ncbi:MAG: hypothetical protein J4F41_09960, partial [Alphaproteobacteria bacterium]|nr:hypothetical protein [Alphaproteobacteria bacterium]